MIHTTGRPFRRNIPFILERLLLFGVFALLAANPTRAGLDDPVMLDIPAQELTDALIQLGTQSEISIVFPSELTRGKQAPPLTSELTPREALDVLLAAYPLHWRALSSRVVALTPEPMEPGQLNGLASPVSELLVVGRQITGSRITRLDFEGSSPVDIISRSELLASGVQTVSDYLKFIPAVSGNSTSTAVSNGGDGTATITLRGLPAANTLVLINGHRTANSGLAGDSVDLNSIPLVAVERLEVLKDGASAIYGSDAIAGVVNIILRREYEGAALEHYYAQTSRGDMETRHTGFVGGLTYNDTRFMLTASHFDQGAIFSRDRELSENADGRPQGGIDNRSSATPFSRIGLPDDEVVILRDAGADPGQVTSYRPATREDLYNYRDVTSSLSPSERSAVYASAIQGISGDTELVAEAGFTETEATVTFAPSPLFTAFEGEPVDVSAANPYNPFGVDVSDVRRRLVELGPRLQTSGEKVLRFNLQLDSAVENTHWSLGVNWNRARAEKQFTGIVDIDAVRRALGADCINQSDCVPLDLFGPPGAIDQSQIDFIRTSSRAKGESRLYEFTAHGDSLLNFHLAGPVGVAGGLAVRRERARLMPERKAGTARAAATNGSRQVFESYVETILPLAAKKPWVEQLELELATRYSEYSDFGSTTNPKIGLRYRPVADLLLRSTYAEGFRAPSLYQLHQDEEQSFDFLDDPCTRQDNVDTLAGCAQLADDSRLQFLTITGGNAELEPEQSSSHTAGLVWTPERWPNFYFSVDWFSIDQEDVIDARAQYVIDQNAASSRFTDQVVRDNNGNIVRVEARNMNVGSLQVEGFDTTLRYRIQSDDLGRLLLSLNGSHLHRYRQQLDAASALNDLAGTFADQASEGAGALPRWKLSGGVSWATADWELNYNVFYVSPLTETLVGYNLERIIDSWITQNMQFNYTTGPARNLRLTVGIENIFDHAPPFAASAFNDNFDARTYEIKGRTWYGQVRYQF